MVICMVVHVNKNDELGSGTGELAPLSCEVPQKQGLSKQERKRGQEDVESNTDFHFPCDGEKELESC